MSHALRGRGTGETSQQPLRNGGLLPRERGAARFAEAAQPKGTGGLGEGVGAAGGAAVQVALALAGAAGEEGVGDCWGTSSVRCRGTCNVGDLLAKPSAVPGEFGGIWDGFLPCQSHHFSFPTFLCKSCRDKTLLHGKDKACLKWHSRKCCFPRCTKCLSLKYTLLTRKKLLSYLPVLIWENK